MRARDNARGECAQVSVIIAAYNSAASIAVAVASVVAQTFQDWELLIIDDCSKDDLLGALQPFARDPRIRVIHRASNGGASFARNTGISLASGRFIAFLDSDDSWMPEKLDRQLALMLKQPEPERAFCVTRTIVNLANGRHIIRPTRGKREGERMDEFIFVSGGFCQTSSFVVSRALAERILFRELEIGEDHIFAIEACASGAQYLLVEDALTVYNNDPRPGRLSNNATLSRGNAFISKTRGLISTKALAGYQARYLGVYLLRSSPLRGLWLMSHAIAIGALRPWFAITLLTRALIPSGLYYRLRSNLLGMSSTPRRR